MIRVRFSLIALALVSAGISDGLHSAQATDQGRRAMMELSNNNRSLAKVVAQGAVDRRTPDSDLALANLVLGYYYRFGERGEYIDHFRAFQHFKEAAAAGNVEATCQIGLMTARGEGVPRNVPNGIQLVENAANSNILRCLNTMVEALNKGVPAMGISPDKDRAAKYSEAMANEIDRILTDLSFNKSKLYVAETKEELAAKSNELRSAKIARKTTDELAAPVQSNVPTAFPDGVWQRDENGGSANGVCSISNSVVYVLNGKENICKRSEGRCTFDPDTITRKVGDNRFVLTFIGGPDHRPFANLEAFLEENGSRLRFGEIRSLSDEYRQSKNYPTVSAAEASLKKAFGSGYYKCSTFSRDEWEEYNQSKVALERERVKEEQKRSADRQAQINRLFMSPSQKRTISLLLLSGMGHHFAGSSVERCSQTIKDFEFGSSDYTRKALVNACKTAIYDTCNVGVASESLCLEGRVVLQDLSDILQCNKQLLQPC